MEPRKSWKARRLEKIGSYWILVFEKKSVPESDFDCVEVPLVLLGGEQGFVERDFVVDTELRRLKSEH